MAMSALEAAEADWKLNLSVSRMSLNRYTES